MRRGPIPAGRRTQFAIQRALDHLNAPSAHSEAERELRDKTQRSMTDVTVALHIVAVTPQWPRWDELRIPAGSLGNDLPLSLIPVANTKPGTVASKFEFS